MFPTIKKDSQVLVDPETQNKIQHFHMEFDCSKCLDGGGDDYSLIEFKKKVKSRMKLGENFKIYSSGGLQMSEADLYFLNEEGNNEATVYVSRACKSYLSKNDLI